MGKRTTVGLICLFLLLLVTVSSFASHPLAHVYLALQALEQAPAPIRALLTENLESYAAGAIGPDVSLLAYPGEAWQGQTHPGDWPHIRKPGQFTTNLFALADSDAELAFVLGWLTHYVVDAVMHGLVNDFGGYYKSESLDPVEADMARERHIELELFEPRHILETRDLGTYFPEGYRFRSQNAPLELIIQAYDATYAEGAPAGFGLRLATASNAMEVAVDSFLPSYQDGLSLPSVSDILAPVPDWLLGPMPSAKEYEQIMEPVQIREVTLHEDHGLRVAYRVNDLRLLKGFVDQWDALEKTAVDKIGAYFQDYHQEPASFELPDIDLLTGLPVGEEPDMQALFPGNPVLYWFLVRASIVDQEGQQWSPWEDGEWVEISPLTDQVWGGRAGEGTFYIPVSSSAVLPLQVSVQVDLGCLDTGRFYLDAGPKSRWQGEISAD